jgi:O-antigen ligase
LLVYFARKRLMAAVMCGIIGVISLPFLSGSYLSWMKSLIGGADDSAISRTTGLINGIEMMLRRPFLGVGPECYPLVRKAWFGWGLEAHNHYGQLMGDLGIAGTIVWGLFLYHLLKNLTEAKKNIAETPAYPQQGLLFIIVGLQISLFVRLFEGWGSHSLYLFYWYVVAALSVIALEITQQRSGENLTPIHTDPGNKV